MPKAFCDARVRVLQGNALGMSAEQLLGQLPQGGTVAGEGYHAVLSDMCHSTLGYAVADVARSLQLAWGTSELALGLQEPNQEDAPWDPGESHMPYIDFLPGRSLRLHMPEGASLHACCAMRQHAQELPARTAAAWNVGWSIPEEATVLLHACRQAGRAPAGRQLCGQAAAGGRLRGLPARAEGALPPGGLGAAQGDQVGVEGDLPGGTGAHTGAEGR